MISAPAQTDQQAWHEVRTGAFTASRFGDLMTPPKTKADREAGRFGGTAMSYIIEKAIERLTGKPAWSSPNAAMRRGTLLEIGALHILSQGWKRIDLTTYQVGQGFGATPDGLVDLGTATMDLKCPENHADVIRFALEVPEGDWDALEKWNRGYAWQIMVQALACGVRTAWLVYFTDRLPLYRLSTDQRNEAQDLIDAKAELYSQENPYPWGYEYATDGYFYVARSFELTDERADQITSTLKRAEVECTNIMHRIKPIIQG